MATRMIRYIVDAGCLKVVRCNVFVHGSHGLTRLSRSGRLNQRGRFISSFFPFKEFAYTVRICQRWNDDPVWIRLVSRML